MGDWDTNWHGPEEPPEQKPTILPNKRTWALFALAIVCFFPVVGWATAELAGLGFVGALLFYLGGTYTWHKYRKETVERKRVLDTIERI